VVVRPMTPSTSEQIPPISKNNQAMGARKGFFLPPIPNSANFAESHDSLKPATAIEQ